MAGLESWPAFQARALEIQMPSDFLDALKLVGIDSFGKLAFICASNPSSGDDAPLRNAVETLIGQPVDDTNMIPLRRLWFESHAIAISDMKARVERTSSDTPRQMPLAERMSRLKRQKEELKGLQIDASLEPSHSLVDKAQAMVDENCIHYIAPEKCVSRELEASKDRQEQAISFDASGNIKVARKALDLKCDTSGELKLKQALTRRSLAMHQTGLASFEILEEWNNLLFSTILREPPSGYQYVSIQQILAADKFYWTRVAQETRGQLQIVAGAPPPLDLKLKDFMYAPDVASLMTFLPSARSSKGDHDKSSDPPTKRPGPPKPPKPSPGDRKVTAKSLLASLPEGCQSKLPSGKWICLFYNKGICKNQKKGQCSNGLHQCYYKGCNKKVPYIECAH